MTDSGRAAPEGALLWQPRESIAVQTQMGRYMAWLRTHKGKHFADYAALWQWSVQDTEGFWGSLWEYFEVDSTTPYRRALSERTLPGAHWFEGSRLNYAEHLLRHEDAAAAADLALLHATETQALAGITWKELGSKVRKLATRLRELGIRPGDRVVSFMPNVPETVIAMLSCLAVGAVWSSAAPEFGSRTVIDRFRQIEPTMLFASDGYVFAGRSFDRSEEIRNIVQALPTLQHVVWLSRRGVPTPEAGWTSWATLFAGAPVDRSNFEYTRVEYDHPIWIVFSSGTTGPPKAIVHAHAGMLLEHLKLVSLHLNLRPGARLFFYTTTGWMMWNVVVSALLAGATAILYDGSPTHPSADLLWRLAAEAKVTHMGASPTFLAAMKSGSIRPGDLHDLRHLEMITVSGSPCPPEVFEWIYSDVKRDVWVASQSGGTEICSAFVGAVPILPVYAGEIQARMLGMDVHCWNAAGEELTDTVGELVVTSPFPSMPLRFWNDPQGRRYYDSYFQSFAGVWRHGDFIKINGRGGCYIYGRSDSTLNRHGVRIGTAEIYRAVELIEEVRDSLIVCLERADGSFFMPLFVQLRGTGRLDETLREKIKARLRREGSPRHVPDRIEQVEAIPYTLTGKKMEVPVRQILAGAPVQSVASRDAMANPDSLDFFVRYRAMYC
jgi:acetoacetyl-CoA synthetase